MKIEVKRFPNRKNEYRHLRKSTHDKNAFLSSFLLFLWFLNQKHSMKSFFFYDGKKIEKNPKLDFDQLISEPNQEILGIET